MSKQFPNYIEARYEKGKLPRFIEHAADRVRINSHCSPSLERVRDVYCRAHLVAAGATEDGYENEIISSDLYLEDEYDTFSQAEKCKTGMILAHLYRKGLIPLSPISDKKTPMPYRFIEGHINYELCLSITNVLEAPCHYDISHSVG